MRKHNTNTNIYTKTQILDTARKIDENDVKKIKIHPEQSYKNL